MSEYRSFMRLERRLLRTITPEKPPAPSLAPRACNRGRGKGAVERVERILEAYYRLEALGIRATGDRVAVELGIPAGTAGYTLSRLRGAGRIPPTTYGPLKTPLAARPGVRSDVADAGSGSA